MAVEERKVKIYTCDNNACGAQTFIRPEIDMEPIGVHGRLTIIHGGGDYVEFYSCKDEPGHITAAIKDARKREDEQD